MTVHHHICQFKFSWTMSFWTNCENINNFQTWYYCSQGVVIPRLLQWYILYITIWVKRVQMFQFSYSESSLVNMQVKCTSFRSLRGTERNILPRLSSGRKLVWNSSMDVRKLNSSSLPRSIGRVSSACI